MFSSNKKIGFAFAVAIFIAGGAAAKTKKWNPVGEYGESYLCDKEAQDEGLHKGFQKLSIKSLGKNIYSVGIGIVTCRPLGHLCDVSGSGYMKNGVIYVMGTPEDDVFAELKCEFEIKQMEDDTVEVQQMNNHSDCERKFLCGANTSIEGKFKRN